MANGKDLDAVLAYKAGLAAADVIIGEKKGRILIGKDTRRSGDMLESAIAAGICAAGCDVVLAGIVPTPAVAYLIKECGFDAGVMISASHNPAQDNGIKVFNDQGFKISEELEASIERKIDDYENIGLKTGEFIGTVKRDYELIDKYVKYVLSINSIDRNIKVLIDCANGSAALTAGRLFDGADIINRETDGLSINKGCGSTYINNLSARVKRGGYDIGFAFDGDADRCLAVDDCGGIICGDRIICILADYLKKDAVAVTKLSNIGLHKFCAERNIKVEQTEVGDRFVLERMIEKDIKIGGEQSGGIIALDYVPTSDGQIIARLILEAMKKSDRRSSEIFGAMRVYPQVSRNVKVANEFKKKIISDAQVLAAVGRIEDKLDGTGRVILRPSGTEPLIRIMIEGESLEKIEEYAK